MGHRSRKCESFPAELYTNFQIPNHKNYSIPIVSVIVVKLKVYKYNRAYKYNKERGQSQMDGMSKLNISGTNIKQPFNSERTKQK